MIDTLSFSDTLRLSSVSGVIPEFVAKWISGHGMPSTYLCLTSCEVDASSHSQSASVPTSCASVPMCRSLSVTSNPISSE